ncbi:MAG: tetratricopeptide repeat protein [Acidobacteria bacterium]|nr:tetratricopeptide repeat protein [Acidobacteriota bacterium]
MRLQQYKKGQPLHGVALFLLSAALVCAQTEQQARQAMQAKQWMSEGRFDEAARAYKALSDALPSNTGLRLNTGLALHMAGHAAEAVPYFEAVLKADANALPALLSLGMARLQLNQPAAAIAPLTKAVTMVPNQVDARGMLANALLSLDRPGEAAPHFRKLTTLTPGDVRAWSGLGKCYESLAAKSFEQIPKGSAEWLALIADTRFVQRQFRSAFYFYKQALDKDPKLRGVHASVARVYQQTGNAEWAAQEQAKEKALARPNCVALPDKQECDFAAGRFLEASSGKSPYWRTRAFNELATRAFAQLGKLPPSPDLYLLKAELASQRGQHAEAAKELAEALKLVPGDRRLEYNYAASVFLSGDYEKAIPLLEREMNRDAKNPEIYFFLGSAYSRLSRPEEALTYLRAAVAYDPKFLDAQAALGRALAQAGKPAEAIPHLEAALPQDEDGSLLYELSRAYQAAGDRDKARAALAKYQEIRGKLEDEKRSLEEEVKITPP